MPIIRDPTLEALYAEVLRIEARIDSIKRIIVKLDEEKQRVSLNRKLP